MGCLGISGQAVLEGVLMKTDSKYALAVRKPDNDIELLIGRINGISEKNIFVGLPFIRGITSFIEEIYIGIKNFSVLGEFYEKEDDNNKPVEKNEKLQFLIVIAIISLAIGLFIALPYGLSLILSKVVNSASLLILAEGIIRLILLILYIAGISVLPDIKRFYMYIGAVHKVINCAEKKIPLTVSNVRRMSKKSYKCGTIYLFTVMIISIVLFMFVRVENIWLRMALRTVIIPAVAAVVYELRKLLEKSDSLVIILLNMPMLLIQGIVASEPEEDIIEVAIKSAEAVLGNEADAEESVKRIENNPVDDEEDDEILNALNHFFNSKKEEDKKRGKKK